MRLSGGGPVRPGMCVCALDTIRDRFLIHGGGRCGYDRGIRIGGADTGNIEVFIRELTLARFNEDGQPVGVDQEFIGILPEGSILVGEVHGQRLVQWINVRKLKASQTRNQ